MLGQMAKQVIPCDGLQGGGLRLGPDLRGHQHRCMHMWIVLPLLVLTSVFAGCRTEGASDRDSDAPAGLEVSPGTADADLRFLRWMRDQNAGILLITHAAERRAEQESGGPDRDRIELLDLREDVEHDRVLRHLRDEYGDSTAPLPPKESHVLVDSMTRLSGGAYDRAFHGAVVQHHRAVIGHIDGYLPVAVDRRVRALAEQIRGEKLRDMEALRELVDEDNRTSP